MISIDFLNFKVAGLEFIDFQNTNFYEELTLAVSECIEEVDGNKILTNSFTKKILPVIEKFTGFSNIKISLEDKGNLAVDTGYFSPGNVLNNKGIENFLKPNKTTLYRWFTQNKEKVFLGGIDYKTGKVNGSFKTVPVKMFVNKNIEDTFPGDKVSKFGVEVAGIIAGAVAHELGHVFGGCMMLHTACSDNLVARSSLEFYKQAERVEERVVVLRDAASLLELEPAKQKELEAIAQSGKDENFIVYFNKLITQRNQKRSLSLGVENMSSEVVADMYAMRMGCGKGIIAAVSILTDIGKIRTVCNSLMTAALITAVATGLFAGSVVVGTLVLGTGFLVTWLGAIFSVSFIFSYFTKGYSGEYNSDYRRIDDLARQIVARVKEDPNVSPADKVELTKELDNLLALGKKVKPWYEGDVLYRFMGWVFSGSDFKLSEIEHYTQAVSNHQINLLSSKIANA